MSRKSPDPMSTSLLSHLKHTHTHTPLGSLKLCPTYHPSSWSRRVLYSSVCLCVCPFHYTNPHILIIHSQIFLSSSSHLSPCFQGTQLSSSLQTQSRITFKCLLKTLSSVIRLEHIHTCCQNTTHHTRFDANVKFQSEKPVRTCFMLISFHLTNFTNFMVKQ